MFLRTKIRAFLESPDLRIHDVNGNPVAAVRIREDFLAIRSFLLGRCRPGEIVAISLDYEYRYLVSMLACMDAGVVFLPLSPSWPEARVEQVRSLTGFHLTIDPKNIDEICGTRSSPHAESFSAGPKDPLYVLFTSGSTGIPKGVVIRREGYENLLRWMDTAFAEIKSGERVLINCEFTFDFSLFIIGLPLLKHCSLYFSRKGDLFRLAAEIERLRVSVLCDIPNNLSSLLSDGIFERADLSSLKYLFLGGARLPYETYRGIFAKMKPVPVCYNAYGPTEASVFTHFRRLTGNEAEDVTNLNVSIGEPISGAMSLLRDPTSGVEVRTPQQPGELLLGGVQLMKEYIGCPAQTQASLVTIGATTYYKTGDIAFFDSKGSYYIVGRLNDTIKKRGYRVDLQDIDAYIQSVPGVLESVTVAIPHSQHEHILIAYVRGDLEALTLKASLAKVLLDFQIPDYIELVDKYPVTRTGKIDRMALAELAKENPRIRKG